ncbi:MAG: phosphatase PAP2 family protein [Clostridia bacterium]|nr:phosphatase PAP2 family protein [Clostridia bacterium]
MINYLSLRPRNLLSDEFRHLLLLLYWPVYGILFWYVEAHYPVENYFAVYHPLDDLIPFCELFVLPYMFWFAFIVGMLAYTLFWDVDAFRRMMWFTIFTYSTTLVIYFLFPTCQELRPAVFERDNFLTRFMADFYAYDTNTNVCPSLHVIGSWAVVFTAWHTPLFRKPAWAVSFGVMGVLISASTVFLKQHSLWDVIAAVPLCIIGWLLCFAPRCKQRVKAESAAV